MFYKNTASQKIAVFAWDTANSTEKTGDSAQITAQISKDGGATAATDDTNPTELDATDAPGIYIFDMLQAETNTDLLTLFAKSSTADIKIEPVIIYTDDTTNLIWDETLTGATHNIATSAGKRLRQIADLVIYSGTAQSGSTINTIKLDAGASASDGAYDPSTIAIIEGTGAGQCRGILEYNGTTKYAVVDRDWKTTPDNTSVFNIYADSGREHVNEGLAQAGGANTITLNTLASSADDAYNGQIVFIRSGVGADQMQIVTDYNGTTKVATTEGAWATQPDTTSAYVMYPFHMEEQSIADKVISTALTEDYGSAGAARTLTELLYEIKAMLTNKDIAGTTLTIYGLDGSTSKKTYTLDSATAPTAIEETT